MHELVPLNEKSDCNSWDWIEFDKIETDGEKSERVAKDPVLADILNLLFEFNIWIGNTS